MSVDQASQPVTTLVIPQLQEEQLKLINPKVVAAIQAIQAEQTGKEPIAWSDFSSHTKNHN